MSALLRLFGRWHVEFGRLGKNSQGGDYVVERVNRIPRPTADERFGMVCWHSRNVKFEGSVVHYLPAKPTAIGDDVAPASVVNTPRGYRVTRPSETYVGGFVRILHVDRSDPVGHYEMDVIVERKVVKVVRFEVVDGANAVYKSLERTREG